MKNKIIFLIIVLFALFFPTKYYNTYHFILLGGASLLILINGIKLNLSLYVKYFLILIFLIIIGSLISSIYLGSDFFRNITEVFRFLPVVLLLLNYKYIEFNKNDLDKIFFVYTFLISILCIFQYLGVESALTISRIYGSELQIENSLLLSNRAIGLSTGPGNNGALFSLLYTYFLSSFLFFRNKKLITSFFMILCIISVVLSQSQTSLVSIALVTIFSLILIFILDNKKFFNIYVLSTLGVMVVGLSFVFIRYLDKFGYLISLFDEGLSRNSYQVRMDKVDEVVELSFSNPIMFWLGYGKDLVPNSSALDNEYIFYLGVYGFFSVVLMVLFYLHFIIFIFNKNKYYSEFMLCAIVFFGAIIAWPSSFTLDPRLLFIFTILMVFSLREKKLINKERFVFK